MNKQYTYLVCPLNWGLGHASRLVPIINKLLKQNHKVLIAADGNALSFIKKEFPHLTHLKLKDVNITFSSQQNIFKLIKLIPRIALNIITEHFRVKKIINNYNIDIVISDNRYGLWNRRVKSILITHQVMIKLPKKISVFEHPIHKIIKFLISQYNECWIPDFKDPNNNLSGDLSHKYPLSKNSFYINPLSRFSGISINNSAPSLDIVAILSGPEPARSDFENILFSELKNSNLKTLIIQGKPNSASKKQHNNITFTPSLPLYQIIEYLTKASTIICRPGYSTIMDLNVLKKSAIIVPTPGQTEQEYLADYHSNEHYLLPQKEISLYKIQEIISSKNH